MLEIVRGVVYPECIHASVQRGKSIFSMIWKLITLSEEWNSLGKKMKRMDFPRKKLINRKTNNYVGGIEN